jgi:UTP--glucose-1-phosphate uridylyltransferase
MFLLDDSRLDHDFLQRFRFDRARFEADLEKLRRGQLSTDSSRLEGPFLPVDVENPAPDRRREARDIGAEALRQGQVANVILNGGMATRFGGVVKGVVPVFDNKSFLALKAEDSLRAAQDFGQSIPLVIMNSFATSDSTQAHFRTHGLFSMAAGDVYFFEQSVAVRMTPDLELFCDDAGRPSYYAPGHGDFFRAITESRTLQSLEDRGVRYLLFSNVDNLAATIDPEVVGHHIRSGCDMTAEVTERQRTASGAWDKGGAPALIDGTAVVVEGFRFPPDFAQETLPHFSTNNMIFGVDAVKKPIDLARHVVEKMVDGRPTLQLESIACEAAMAKDASGAQVVRLGLLEVPRSGPRGRFFPVKEPNDLEDNRTRLKDRLHEGWMNRKG